MHGRAATPSDPCDFSQEQSLIATGDASLSATVSAIMNSQAWTGNSVIFITWDESDFTGTGPLGFGDTSGGCDSPSGNGGVRFPPVAQLLAVLNTVVLSLMDLHLIPNVARQLRRFASHPVEALNWVCDFL